MVGEPTDVEPVDLEVQLSLLHLSKGSTNSSLSQFAGVREVGRIIEKGYDINRKKNDFLTKSKMFKTLLKIWYVNKS